LAHARNQGAAVADAPWLCFFDADVLLAPQFVDTVVPMLRDGCYYRAQPYQDGTWGTCICARRDFRRAGGYDDVMEGWGREDIDLYQHLQFFGIVERAFPAELVAHLAHGDEMRVAHYEIKKMDVSHTINWVYSQAPVRNYLVQ
jgi:hypothetical protein